MLDQLKALVYEAGDLVRSGYSAVEMKGSVSNVVTDSDQAVQDFLVSRLREIFVDIDFICEEVCETPGEIPCTYTAVIDPIDGTSNFVRGMNLSAVSVAVLRRGKPWLGAVYLPYTDELFSAEAGCGAFLNGKAIHVSDRPMKSSCMFTAWSLYDKTLSQPCFDICREIYPEMDDFRRLGSAALELCYLAAGRCELYFEIRLFPWDFAAAGLIVEEAGGCIDQVGFATGDFTRPSSFLAANTPSSMARLKQIVTNHLPEDLYRQEAFAKLF